jgi:hypothetical protein
MYFDNGPAEEVDLEDNRGERLARRIKLVRSKIDEKTNIPQAEECQTLEYPIVLLADHLVRPFSLERSCEVGWFERP